MIEQTKGIVLKQIKYGETSLIIKVYTADFGLQSYMVKGVKNKKNKQRFSAMFQPLSFIEFSAFNRKAEALNTFKEGKVFVLYKELRTEPIKMLIALFLNEVLVSILKEGHSDEILFNFLSQSIQFFDQISYNYVDFHLWFMIQLTHFLGFFPLFNKKESNKPFFNLLEGRSTDSKGVYTCTNQETNLVKSLTESNFEDITNLKLNRAQRQQTLDILIRYYSLHDYNLLNLKSLNVIKEVLN